MNGEEIKSQIESLDWYHSISLNDNLVTKGHYNHKPYLKYYGLPLNLTGKTALDIGAASGFFTFEMEKRGADVTATDLPTWKAHDFSPLYQDEKSPEQTEIYLHDPFLLAHRVLNSKAKRQHLSIYDINPETVGTFDLVFCGSVLVHLTDPVKALWNIQQVTKGVAIIATSMNPDSRPEPKADFVGHHRGDGYWIPNRAGLEAMVQTAGFAGWEIISEFSLDYRDGTPGAYHAVVRAWNNLEGFAFPTVDTQQNLAITPATEADKDAEIARLQALVSGYKQGKVMRLMNWLHNLKP